MPIAKGGGCHRKCAHVRCKGEDTIANVNMPIAKGEDAIANAHMSIAKGEDAIENAYVSIAKGKVPLKMDIL